MDDLAPQPVPGCGAGCWGGVVATITLLLALSSGVGLLHGQSHDGAVSNSLEECTRAGALLFGVDAYPVVGDGWTMVPDCEVRYRDSIFVGFEHETLLVQLYLELLDGRESIGVVHSALFDVKIKGSDIDCDHPDIRRLLAVVENRLGANEVKLTRFLEDEDAFWKRMSARQGRGPGPDQRLMLSWFWLGLFLTSAVTWLLAFFSKRRVMGAAPVESNMGSVILVAIAWVLALGIPWALSQTEPLFVLDGKDYSLTGVASLLFLQESGSLFHTPLFGWFQSFVTLYSAEAFSGSGIFRLWTILLSSVSIPAVWYAVSRLTGNWRVAVLAAFILATSPIELDLSLRSHPYVITQAALFGAWAAYAWFRENPVFLSSLTLVLLCSVAIWSNPLAVFGILCLFCFIFFDASSRTLHWRKKVVVALAICIFCAPLAHMILRGLVAYVSIAGARPGMLGGASIAPHLPIAFVAVLAATSAIIGLYLVRRSTAVEKTLVLLSLGLLTGAAALGFATQAEHEPAASEAARQQPVFSPRSSFAAGRPAVFVAAFSPPFIHSNHHFIEYFSPQEGACKAPAPVVAASLLLLVLVAIAATASGDRRRLVFTIAHAACLLFMFLLSRLIFVRSVNLDFLAVGGLMVFVFGLDMVRNRALYVALGLLVILAQLYWMPNVLTPAELLPMLADSLLDV